ncbi:MAG: hypothetical protein ABDH18_03250 [Aquificaceae bacterium]
MLFINLAIAGAIALALGSIFPEVAILGAIMLIAGGLGLDKIGQKTRILFSFGVFLALSGGLWAHKVLENSGFDFGLLSITALISGTGLYLQSLLYRELSEVYSEDLTAIGGYLMLIGAWSFLLLFGFIALFFGVIFTILGLIRVRSRIKAHKDGV